MCASSSRSSRGGDEVFFFYSGHGVQIEAMNYLLDVRAEVNQVRDDALALSTVLGDLRAQKPSLTLAVVDACRDNPFKGTGRKSAAGEEPAWVAPTGRW